MSKVCKAYWYIHFDTVCTLCACDTKVLYIRCSHGIMQKWSRHGLRSGQMPKLNQCKHTPCYGHALCGKRRTITTMEMHCTTLVCTCKSKQRTMEKHKLSLHCLYLLMKLWHTFFRFMFWAQVRLYEQGFRGSVCVLIYMYMCSCLIKCSVCILVLWRVLCDQVANS